MSPQPKWRVSAERLTELTEPVRQMPEIRPEFWALERQLALDNIDARAEIDTLQAAVRINREYLAAALAYNGEVKPDDVGWRWESVTKDAAVGHCGDCTKEAHTCSLCMRERCLEEADWIIETLATLARTDKLLPEDE